MPVFYQYFYNESLRKFCVWLYDSDTSCWMILMSLRNSISTSKMKQVQTKPKHYFSELQGLVKLKGYDIYFFYFFFNRDWNRFLRGYFTSGVLGRPHCGDDTYEEVWKIRRNQSCEDYEENNSIRRKWPQRSQGGEWNQQV